MLFRVGQMMSSIIDSLGKGALWMGRAIVPCSRRGIPTAHWPRNFLFLIRSDFEKWELAQGVIRVLNFQYLESCSERCWGGVFAPPVYKAAEKTWRCSQPFWLFLRCPFGHLAGARCSGQKYLATQFHPYNQSVTG